MPGALPWAEAAPAAPWLPGLAPVLVRDFWETAARGVAREEYGSGRWLSADRRAPRKLLAGIELGPGATFAMELLEPAIGGRYASLDLVLDQEPDVAVVLPLVTEAVALLKLDPGLGQSIAALCRSFHILSSEGPGFDTSHSDPELPFSLFVSVPVGERDAAARLAESILHEAMHLQLSLIEARYPLVQDESGTGYSPWQQRQRPVSGLLHGLYVFSVIDAYFRKIAHEGRLPALPYLQRRREEIAPEIAAVSNLALKDGLTPAGRSLAEFLLANHCARESRAPSS